jgi:hypothetical protein
MSGKIVCAPWCRYGDGHPQEHFRADQWCQGPQHMTILGLESAAPALPVKEIAETPALTVYARRGWYALPTVRMNVNREHINDHLAVDVDFDLTPFEAIELAGHLIAVAEMIGGAG